MGSVRSKPWIEKIPKASQFILVKRLAKEFNIGRDLLKSRSGKTRYGKQSFKMHRTNRIKTSKHVK